MTNYYRTPLKRKGFIRPLSRYAKFLSAFFIINFLSSLVAPNVAHALTSGPTAPEYTSFEPVDTTDMVNLATGDLVYNLPLLEVPGPAGGYPLSLSYHAGIMPREEASWVGLGWTLNPGAITRTVNGYPDDQLGAIRERTDYVDGGTRHEFSLGVGVPGVSFGVTVSNDTYLGFGVGTSMSLIAGIPVGGGAGSLGLNATIGHDGYGNTYSGVGAGLTLGVSTKSAGSLSSNIGVSSNFNSVSFSNSISYGYSTPAGSIGANLSSKGLKPSATVAGITASQHNSKADNWTVNSHGFSVPVPLPGPLWLSLGYRYTRYYIDETSEVSVIGAYHTDQINKTRDEYDTWGYDAYSLPQIDLSLDDQDTEKDYGGTFPAYDHYSVTGQGISGTMRPYGKGAISIRKQNLVSDVDDRNYEILYFSNYNSPVKSFFKFDNDFSNKLVYDVKTNVLDRDKLSYDLESGSPGWENAYSKHVANYTNQEIRDGVAFNDGFVDYQDYSMRTNSFKGDVSDQIGGYSITNESGVTYHYALPVYAYGEYSINQKRNKPKGSDGAIFTEYRQDDSYAYTWLLTAITGPDYVDRSNNGILDDQDWGYWVKFDYGLWTSNYKWRSPEVGTHIDIDSDFESYSYGTKQLYYLNTIETKTHVAVFEKDLRADGKGVYDLHDGGFGYRTETRYIPNNIPPESPDDYVPVDVTDFSHASLKLDNIYLLDKKDIVPLNNLGDNFSESHTYTGSWNGRTKSVFVPLHQEDNVIDKYDLNALKEPSQTYRQYLQEKSLRIISLGHSYDLQDASGNGGVPNSFDVNGSGYAKFPSSFEDDTKFGKLTLQSLDFKGKKGYQVTPGMKFSYAKNPVWKSDHHDIWGFYKEDYRDLGNENLSRMVTKASSGEVDAWSLTNIQTSLGETIQIDYESDSHSKPALINQYVFPVDKIIGKKLYFSNEVPSLNDIFSDEEEIETTVFRYYISRDSFTGSEVIVPYPYKKTFTIKNIVDQSTQKYIEVYEDIFEINLTSTQVERGIYAMNVASSEGFSKVGGGTRVKSIKVGNRKTNYYYDWGGQTSGATSYEPYGMDYTVYFDNILFENIDNSTNSLGSEGLHNAAKAGWQTVYQELLNENFSNLLLLSREVQAPGVIYEYVTVEEEVNGRKVPGKQVYNFQIFEQGMIEHRTYNEGDWPMTISNYTTRVGNLKSVRTFGSDDELILEKKTNYLYEEGLAKNGETVDWVTTNQNFRSAINTKFNDHGVFMEFYNEDKQVELPNPVGSGVTFDRRNSYSLREFFPSIVVGNTTTNHKTGITTESKNLAFDFYSGEATTIYNDDGYGNKYLTKSIPAYHFYDGMNSPLEGGNNMLTQEGASFSYLMNDSFNPSEFTYEDLDEINTITSSNLKRRYSVLGATMQTWSNQIPLVEGNTRFENPHIDVSETLYRKQSNYSFIGPTNTSLIVNGGFIGAFTELSKDNLASNLSNSQWRQDAAITLYDVNSHALEATDVNGSFTATKFDNQSERVFATVANAAYNEFAYSGAEDDLQSLNSVNYFGGGVVAGGSIVVSTEDSPQPVHTGIKSVRTTGTGKPYSYLLPQTAAEKRFKASVWANHSSASLKYSVNGGTAVTAGTTESKKAGDWYLIEMEIDVPESFSTLEVFAQRGSGGATIYWDDFRVHPIDATMTSYAYNEWGELSEIHDANNLFTRYQYDEAGRLDSVFRETFQHEVLLVSYAKIDYSENLITSNLEGSIKTSYTTGGKLRMEFNFSSPGSGSYTYDWKVNGVSLGTDSYEDLAVLREERKFITVDITDQLTGQEYSSFKQEDLQICPVAGTLVSSICQTGSNGCRTGWVNKVIAKGDCTTYSEFVFDNSICATSNGLECNQEIE